MMDPKEVYMQEHMRIAAELKDDGYSEQAAYDAAGGLAYHAMRDRFADMADQAQQQQRDAGL